MTSYQEHLEFAKKLAYEAGLIMKKYFLTSDTVWKSDNTPATQADTEINSLVIKRITAAYPDHSVLGEEESSNIGKEYTWVCDPVDGTMQYSHGLQISTFSLALCCDGDPVIGVVYDPFTDRLFYAAKDQGAFCNDKKLSVNQNGFQNALIDLEVFPSPKNILSIDASFNDKLIEKGAKTVVLWSAIMPCALVASGDYSAVVFNFFKPEDGAAIKIIIQEAGGRVTDLYGQEQRYDQKVKGFLASNGVIHDEIIEMLQEFNDEI